MVSFGQEERKKKNQLLKIIKAIFIRPPAPQSCSYFRNGNSCARVSGGKMFKLREMRNRRKLMFTSENDIFLDRSQYYAYPGGKDSTKNHKDIASFSRFAGGHFLTRKYSFNAYATGLL